MSTVTLTCSVSVDGFATGPDGDLSRLHRWLFDFESNHPLDYEDENMAEFRAAGAIVFGHTTFRSGEVPWGEADVFHAPVFVLTHERGHRCTATARRSRSSRAARSRR